jgi:hypothetical protein
MWAPKSADSNFWTVSMRIPLSSRQATWQRSNLTFSMPSTGILIAPGNSARTANGVSYSTTELNKMRRYAIRL